MKPTTCLYDPRQTHGAVGMHHCPDCGEMQLAGFQHTAIMEDLDWEEITLKEEKKE